MTQHPRPDTSAVNARTRPDPDTDVGVRVEYRARVPRHQLGAALADALGHIAAAETTTAYTPPGPPNTGRPDTVRRELTDTLGYISTEATAAYTTDTVRTQEPTSLLGQMAQAMTPVLQQRVDDQVEASAAEHCAALAAAALGYTADIFPPTGYAHVSGRCPACNRTALFLADGGYVTCSHLECPRPDAAADLLDHPPFRTRVGCNDCPTEGTTTS
ncbi:hypothetical protein ABT358_02190 [Streptomyces sp. NPDC000341]|uniref:hypothetical protein n=1 Tax=Streptomyces sp. NPDC000341 TaxID=3156645 RepID=UPI00331BDFC9